MQHGKDFHTLLYVCPFYVLQYNSIFDVIVSADESGMVEYWGGASESYSFPKCVHFEHKIDTDLYEFAKVRDASMVIVHCVMYNNCSVYVAFYLTYYSILLLWSFLYSAQDHSDTPVIFT